MNIWRLFAVASGTPIHIEVVNRPDSRGFIVQCVLAGLTLAAVVAAAFAAWAAGRSARAASRGADAASRQAELSRRALSHEQVRDLSSEFDKHGYFLRFWRLDMLTRDLGKIPIGKTRFAVYNRFGKTHPLTDSVIGPSGLTEDDLTAKVNDLKRRLTPEIRQLVLDALGPESSPNSFDFLTVYWFSLKLEWFLEGDRVARADELTRVFGYQLVVTLIRHRTLAARLDPQPDSGRTGDYYGQEYGLTDSRYAELVESLFEAAVRQNLLPLEAMENLRAREVAISSLRSYGYIGAKFRPIETVLSGP